jgi:two-component system, cell cycle sensor histidine kinase and response regulator CckA
MRRLNIETLLRANLVDLRRQCKNGARVQIQAVDPLPDVENDPDTLLRIFKMLAEQVCEVNEPADKVAFTFTMVEMDEASIESCIFADRPPKGERYATTELSYSGDLLAALDAAPTFEQIDSSNDPLLQLLATVMRETSCVLRITSAPGNQTRIALLCPPAQDRKPVVVPDDDVVDSEEVSVLVVDDEEFVLVMVKTVLKNAGFRVITAENGAAGLETYREASDEIDVVILDMMLPVLTGEQVHAEIRKLNNDVPILVSSGFTSTEMDSEMQDSPNTHFLQKPYQPDLLVKKLKGIIADS